MDRGAWQATLLGVTKSRTQLKQLGTAQGLMIGSNVTNSPKVIQSSDVDASVDCQTTTVKRFPIAVNKSLP